MKWLRAGAGLLLSIASALSSPLDTQYQQTVTLEPSEIDVTKWNWSVGCMEASFYLMADIFVVGIRWDCDIR